MPEIWRDFQEKVVNEAAADWLLREGDLREPRVFFNRRRRRNPGALGHRRSPW